MPPCIVSQGKVWLWPSGLNQEFYKKVIHYEGIWIAYANTLFYTVVGTVVDLAFTTMGAYSLSKKRLLGRKPITLFITFAMLFSPGMIPIYLLANGQEFIELTSRHSRIQLFYLWGHSFEFENNNNWEDMEKFCAMIGNRPELWYATNIEVLDYVKALKSLRFSVDQTRVYNPTATDFWITAEGSAVKIPAGQHVKL
ncbi:hypothetical protein [Paenibacillus mesotrionivorans]|uniref:Uncharacterized protein n=1 Tax=Paenibacillus mesotrionivorans TaxID=3160968 RepID=A0ACC7NWX5_9BACL